MQAEDEQEFRQFHSLPKPPALYLNGASHSHNSWYEAHPLLKYSFLTHPSTGGGAGGIAVAARLAKKGYKVTVVEKNADIGGRCSLMQENDYVCPSIYLSTILTASALRPRPLPPPYAVLLPPDIPRPGHLHLRRRHHPPQMRPQLPHLVPGSRPPRLIH